MCFEVHLILNCMLLMVADQLQFDLRCQSVVTCDENIMMTMPLQYAF